MKTSMGEEPGGGGPPFWVGEITYYRKLLNVPENYRWLVVVDHVVASSTNGTGSPVQLNVQLYRVQYSGI